MDWRLWFFGSWARRFCEGSSVSRAADAKAVSPQAPATALQNLAEFEGCSRAHQRHGTDCETESGRVAMPLWESQEERNFGIQDFYRLELSLMGDASDLLV
jgi:hypothetical protein